jgi:hypothetical protein
VPPFCVGCGFATEERASLFLDFSDKEPAMNPLRQRMIEDLRVRNYAPKTEQTYPDHISRFARHFDRSREVLGAEEIRAYQLHLLEKGISWSQFNQAVCALRNFPEKSFGSGGNGRSSASGASSLHHEKTGVPPGLLTVSVKRGSTTGAMPEPYKSLHPPCGRCAQVVGEVRVTVFSLVV